jgi:hypothetical protein
MISFLRVFLGAAAFARASLDKVAIAAPVSQDFRYRLLFSSPSEET